jgi:citrate lyase subunit beta/citryl-CoA lyase
MTASRHPADVLFEEGDTPPRLPVCDHYCGVESRMRKSLEIQAEMGPVFDVTLDGEAGAPVGGEVEQAHLIAELIDSRLNVHGRVGARCLPLGHPAFDAVLQALLPRAGARLAYLMVPKPGHLGDVAEAASRIDVIAQAAGIERVIPLHTLIETHGALRDVEAIAAHPRIESLSFGLMDFVSAHRGAIPQSAMGAEGQFKHPLVLRAKLAISAACHAEAKVPSHCVVTEFKDKGALQQAAEQACRSLGYTRMWSIHPDQILPIVEAFAPRAAEIDQAVEIISAGQAADWAPIRHRFRGRDQLHDRASYRYFWQVLQRAESTSVRGGPQLPAEVRLAFFAQPSVFETS